MQVFIHMLSYSLLPPCLRHCAIHSRRYAGWSRGSSRSFPLPLFLLTSLYHRGTIGAKIPVKEPRGTRCGDSFRNPAGVVFPSPAENGRIGECIREGIPVSYMRMQRPLIWNTYTRGYSASLYLTRMQIFSILDFSRMRRSGEWWLVLRHFSIFSPALSFFVFLVFIH